jgi:hypothetical protein
MSQERTMISQPNGHNVSRTEIDVAIGILVALRRCPRRQAFEELAAAVRESGVGLSTTCRGLVALASGATDDFPSRSEVVERWGDLFAHRSDDLATELLTSSGS